MDRGLVVVDDTESHRELLREAAAFAAGTGAELVLVALLSSDEVERNSETVEAIESAEHTHMDPDAPLEVGRTFAGDLAEEVLGDLEVSFETIASVADEEERSTRILEIAEEEGCDHVFVVGRRRSPTGKAIFGDTAQAVALNFDGPVTIVTG